jgi:ATP-dependent Clp protease ATP-binding subunit ClpA
MSNFGFAVDHGETAQYTQAKDKVMESLKTFFRPEFLNRLDEVIVFDLLTPEVISCIVDIQMKDVIVRLDKKEIKLSVSPEVMHYLAKEGYDPKFGARPLRRVIQSKILTPVANMMVGEGMLQGGTVKVGLKKDQLDFEVKKSVRAKVKPVTGEESQKRPTAKKEKVIV